MTVSRNVPLRRRLLLLAGVGIVPLAIMAGIGLYALAHQQRVQAERVGIELARAVATAVDAELRSAISVLEALATSLALDNADMSGFRERALRILDTQPHWAALSLADPSGTRLFDTRYRAGEPLAAHRGTPEFRPGRTHARARAGQPRQESRWSAAVSGPGAGTTQPRIALRAHRRREAGANSEAWLPGRGCPAIG